MEIKMRTRQADGLAKGCPAPDSQPREGAMAQGFSWDRLPARQALSPETGCFPPFPGSPLLHIVPAEIPTHPSSVHTAPALLPASQRWAHWWHGLPPPPLRGMSLKRGSRQPRKLGTACRVGDTMRIRKGFLWGSAFHPTNFCKPTPPFKMY